MLKVVLGKLVRDNLIVILSMKSNICFSGARIILFIAFLLSFGALIGGAWVLFGYYVAYKKDPIYPGIAVFVQNLAIFLRFVTYSFYFHFLFISILCFFQHINHEIRP